MGRNDRLGSGLGERGRKAEARKREEVAKDRVGRAVEKKQENGDRGGKASGRTRKEAAKNRVGRNDRLGSGLFCFSSLLFNSPYCRKFTIFGSRHAVKIVSVSEFVGHNYSKW